MKPLDLARLAALGGAVHQAERPAPPPRTLFQTDQRTIADLRSRVELLEAEKEQLETTIRELTQPSADDKPA